eukprot:269708-Amphidinium_carterae.1
MAEVEANRERRAVCAVLPVDAQASAALLYSGLVACCNGKSLVIVERCGAQEGLEVFSQSALEAYF